MKYTGVIIEESLKDTSVLEDVEIISSSISENSGWHMHTILVSEEDFIKLSKVIKPKKYYMHFWKDREVVAIFRDKIFKFNFDDKSTWKDTVDYGLSLGIPIEQLDFPIE